MEDDQDVPRRTCRGRPLVCPGPCNPRFRVCQQRAELRRKTVCARDHPVCTVLRSVHRHPGTSGSRRFPGERSARDAATVHSDLASSPTCRGRSLDFKMDGLRAALENARLSVCRGTRLAVGHAGDGLRWLGSARKLCVPCTVVLPVGYAVFHGLLAAVAWRDPGYQLFLSSQVCGVLAVFLWTVSGTIPF